MVDLGGPNFLATTDIILEKAQVTGLRVHDLAARLIAETVRCLRYKETHLDELSSTSFVLTAFRSLSALQHQNSKEVESLRSALESSGLNEDDLEQMSAGFFSHRPPMPAETDEDYDQVDARKVTLGPGIRQAIGAWQIDLPLEAGPLVRQLLARNDTGIFKRVSEVRAGKSAMSGRFSDGGDDPAPSDDPALSDELDRIGQDADASPPAGAPASSSGRRHVRIVREAIIEELALNVGDYAKALATILRVSEGEFSFALFGKWGSGKTTLLRLLKPLLEDPAEYRKNIVVPSGETYADLSYKVVVHNAWKYRNPPEAWVYLYKSLATAVVSSAGPVERWALALRVANDRNGLIALLASLAVVAIALVPIQAKFQLASLVISGIGFSALVYAAAIWMGASSKVKQLFHRNLRLVGRDENLGMLALIGDDVRFLMRGWTKERTSSQAWLKLIAPLLCILALSAIWAVCLWRGFPLDLSTIAGAVGLSWQKDPEPLAVDWMHWTVLAIWTIFAVFLVVLPTFARERRPDKVLLVVDDLDRCSPKEMLSVIENVRLLLDDDEISSRLQVLMLVDENVLEHAIASRYEEMIKDRTKHGMSGPDVVKEIVSEQIEKLFACHLRFSQLSDDDVQELVAKLAGHENEQIRKAEDQRGKEAREARLRDAQRELMLANDREASARKALEDVAAGKPAARIDEDGPSRNQRRGAGAAHLGDYRPKGLEERRQAASQNERIDAENQDIASMTEQQRLARRGDVVKALEDARLAKEASQRALDALPRDAAEPETTPTEVPFETGDVRFSDDEIQTLRGFMPGYFRSIRRSPSPRSIKAFLFKLQLARLLMQLRYPNRRDDATRFNDLLKAFQREATSTVDEETDHIAIVRQVI
jgi:energy-coupling factor transporter ATP-binding protein EcfA2